MNDVAVPVAAKAPPRDAHRGRLFRKYLLLILTLITTALLASGAISVYFSYQEIKAALSNLQNEKALAAASRIEQYIHQIEQQLAYAALPQLDASDVELRRIEFLKLLRQAPEVTDISQLDPSGIEQISVSRLGMDNPKSGKDRSQEPAFRMPKRGKPYFGPVYFRKETEPYMTIAVRSGGDAGPVTVADVNLKFIWDVVSRIKIGDKGKAYVVDRNGFLIADPDIGLVLRKTDLSMLKHVKAAIAGQGTDDEAILSNDLGGTPVLTSESTIEPLAWHVFVEQPVNEVYAKLYSSVLRTGLLLLAGLVISALGALALARGMVRPIHILDEGARRIGEGNLDQKINIHTGDELEGLADQFNRMTGQLRESYAGLERKVDERTSELQSSLEQQTAISEILRVISSSPTDVAPVLRAVAERAAHLCRTPYARVFLVDGGLLRPRADLWVSKEVDKAPAPVPLSRSSVVGRATLDRATIHLTDVVPLLDSEFPDARPNVELTGQRASLAVPLMREGGAYGAILLYRLEPVPFTADQIALVETFARQAAIAIDNVRLFNETKEALGKQTATTEILRVISSSPTNTRPVFDAIAERAVRLCDANQGFVFTYDGEWLNVGSSFGVDPLATKAVISQFPMRASGRSMASRAVLEGTVINVDDVLADPDYPLADAARIANFRGSLGVPMRREGQIVGAITVTHEAVAKFTDKQIDLLTTFADQAVIAIENVRLFNETKEALDQQTAISEILRTISSSPTDVQPVLDAIADRAQELCGASAASIHLTDGNMLRHVASKGESPEEAAATALIPISRDSISGRAVLEHKTIHVHDVLEQAAEYPVGAEISRHVGNRTLLATPLYREGQPFGTILLRRKDVRAFSEREVALLKTFGDQAAIAIENVRLFNETKEALDQQRASGEVLAAISNSIADTKPVFETILASCERLFVGKQVGINLINDDGTLKLGAYHGPNREEFERLLATARADDSTYTGRAVRTRMVQHIPDYEGPDVPEGPRASSRLTGVKAGIYAPMIWEGTGLGVIWVARDFAGPFSDKDIALLKTFADQAVIAIQNARLVNETREALEQQRASGEVLAAISSSIADTAPVFERIMVSCERLFTGKVIAIEIIDAAGMIHVEKFRGPGGPDHDNYLIGPVVPNASISANAILSRNVQHVQDILNDKDVPKRSREGYGEVGVRSAIVAPMLWEGEGIGAISVGREHAGNFSDKDIALLKTFADQAVIAIQNARLFREIEDKSRQLEIANQHKSEFLANMSHELRTPLNAIIGFSEVLLERLFGDINEKQDDYLKDIHSSGRHLLNLINDILDLSKVEAGRMELDLSTFDLPTAIANAMTLIRERAQRHGIAMQQEMAAQVGEVVADERKFKQILLNLLSNAVKFTPDGGTIKVSARREQDNILVAVHDTGIGIAPEDQEAVFEEFRQVGRNYTSKQEGTGLGLALTRRFVELHGGRISVASVPGKGSTFTFTIPVKRVVN